MREIIFAKSKGRFLEVTVSFGLDGLFLIIILYGR